MYPGTRITAYIAHEDNLARVIARGGIVGEGIRCRGRTGTNTGTSASTSTGVEAASTTKAAAATESPKSTATAKPTAAAKPTAKAAAAAKTAAAAKAASAGKAVLTDLQDAALPIIAIELLDCIPRIVRAFEHNYSGALGSAVGPDVYVGAGNTSRASYICQ